MFKGSPIFMDWIGLQLRSHCRHWLTALSMIRW